MKMFILLTVFFFVAINDNAEMTSKRSMELTGGLSHYIVNSDNVVNGPNGNVSFYLSKYKNKRWKYSAGISYKTAQFEYNANLGWFPSGIRYNHLKYAQIPVMVSRRFFFWSNHNLNIASGFYLSRLLEWSTGEIVNGSKTSVTYF